MTEIQEIEKIIQELQKKNITSLEIKTNYRGDFIFNIESKKNCIYSGLDQSLLRAVRSAKNGFLMGDFLNKED